MSDVFELTPSVGRPIAAWDRNNFGLHPDGFHLQPFGDDVRYGFLMFFGCLAETEKDTALIACRCSRSTEKTEWGEGASEGGTRLVHQNRVKMMAKAKWIGQHFSNPFGLC